MLHNGGNEAGQSYTIFGLGNCVSLVKFVVIKKTIEIANEGESRGWMYS